MAITFLREGDQNEYVRIMKQYLINLRYDIGNTNDVFDRQTTWAVKWFQIANGLTADGICGIETRDKLISPNAQKGIPSTHETWNYGMTPLYYCMNDPKWSFYPYDAKNTSTAETLGRTGCGPTTMASILTNLLGKAVLPPVLCDWANTHGYRDPDAKNGTYTSFFAKCAKRYGLRTATIDIVRGSNPLTANHFKQIDRVLKLNSLVACSVNGNSPYTTGGHYIMIWKIENGKVYIKDPVKNNNRLQSYPVDDWAKGKWVKRFIRIGK